MKLPVFFQKPLRFVGSMFTLHQETLLVFVFCIHRYIVIFFSGGAPTSDHAHLAERFAQHYLHRARSLGFVVAQAQVDSCLDQDMKSLRDAGISAWFSKVDGTPAFEAALLVRPWFVGLMKEKAAQEILLRYFKAHGERCFLIRFSENVYKISAYVPGLQCGGISMYHMRIAFEQKSSSYVLDFGEHGGRGCYETVAECGQDLMENSSLVAELILSQ